MTYIDHAAEAYQHIIAECRTAQKRRLTERRQIDGHHKLDCGRRS